MNHVSVVRLYLIVCAAAVALPLSSAGLLASATPHLTGTFVGGVIADLIVIPWAYVFAHYVRAPGDPWRFASPLSTPAVPTGAGGGRA
jgi:hypothetical protein